MEPRSFCLEAPPGFGPGVKVLQTSALPLGYGALSIFCKVAVEKVHTPQRTTVITVRKAPLFVTIKTLSPDGAGYEARTRYLHLGKVALYQMS